jgi:hypothetical protein
VIVARKFHIGQLVATGQEPEAVFHNFLSKKGVISARSNDHCRKWHASLEKTSAGGPKTSPKGKGKKAVKTGEVEDETEEVDAKVEGEDEEDARIGTINRVLQDRLDTSIVDVKLIPKSVVDLTTQA